ncbi:MAG: hypothetical protein WB762_15845 [Candidatus Sulfotelmatobacter sp.]
MKSPDIPITEDYLYTLAKPRTQLEHQPLPPYPEHDAQQHKIWQEIMQAQDK